jgi:hypothetical protein
MSEIFKTISFALNHKKTVQFEWSLGGFIPLCVTVDKDGHAAHFG